MDVFQFIGDKKFLIGIGRDTGSACAGYGDPARPAWAPAWR